MRTMFWMLTGLALAASIAQAQITYVDLTAGPAGNTMVWNGGSPVEWNTTGDNAADGLWRARAFGVSNTIFEAGGGGAEDAVGLVTTVTGLNPGAIYEVSAFFWSDGSNWGLKGSISNAPPLDPANNDPSISFTRNGSATTSAGVVVPTNAASANNGTIFVQNNVLAAEGNRLLYQAALGSVVADGSGVLRVYLDDRENVDLNQRTWLDGIGYKEVGEIANFDQDPADADVVLGANATLEVMVSSLLSYSLQWRLDGGAIAGATNLTYTILGAQLADAGTYDVVATTSGGTSVSDTAQVSVLGPPINPAGQVVLTGFPATFTVGAPAASTGYTFQWFQGATLIPGATNQAYTIASVTTNDVAVYSAEMTLNGDTVASGTGRLLVPPPPAAPYDQTILADGPIAYWRLGEAVGESFARDSADGFDLIVDTDVRLELPGVVLGDANTAAEFAGTTDSVLSRTDFDPGLNPAVFSVEFWGLPAGGGGDRAAVASRDIFVDENNGYEVTINAADQWQFRTGPGFGDWNTLVGPAVNFGSWAHVVATYDGTDMVLYVNGVEAGRLDGVSYAPQAYWEFRVGGGASEQLPPAELWRGGLDEVALYDNALSAQTVLAHYAAIFQLSAPPLISQSPRDIGVLLGESGSFDVGVLSGSPPTYQWQHNGTDLVGETNTILQVGPVTLDSGGEYRVRVSSPGGSTLSDPGVLVPLADPLGTFYAPTAGNTVLTRDGSSDWFLAGAGSFTPTQGRWAQRDFWAIPGLADYGYQWSPRNGTGSGSVELRTTVTGLTPGTAYALWVIYSHKPINDVGSELPNQPALFGGLDDGRPLTQFTPGNSLDTGTGPGDGWINYHGFVGVQAADIDGQINVLVDYVPDSERGLYMGVGYQFAAPAPAPPMITIPPESQAALVGNRATFGVGAASVLPLTYQWRQDGADLPGETNTTLTVAGVRPGDAGLYDVVVANTEGGVTSAPVYLVVLSNYFGTFVFPDTGNTVLTRNDDPNWFADEATAESNGLWIADADFAIPGRSDATNGFMATQATEATADVQIRTTLSGLDPAETYAVWILFSYEPGSQYQRVGAGLDGEALRSWDDESGQITAITNGPAGERSIHMGFLGVRTPSPAGELAVLVDFRGLEPIVFNGVSYQPAILVAGTIPMDIQNLGGAITISWPDNSAVLQQSADLANPGAWTDVPGAPASPYTDPGTSPVRSFRLRE